MHAKKFKVDEWVLYSPFHDSQHESLKNDKRRALILTVLDTKDMYDYRIFIDDGSSKIKKVREIMLSRLPHSEEY
tara:strand:+ start:27 stop:251 length:225 start_codon:yes stop_codon:yes gene_type:complete